MDSDDDLEDSEDEKHHNLMMEEMQAKMKEL